MSSKEATKEVEADEVIAADAKKDAVKGTKRPAEVSFLLLLNLKAFFTCNYDCLSEWSPRVLPYPSAAIGAWALAIDISSQSKSFILTKFMTSEASLVAFIYFIVE